MKWLPTSTPCTVFVIFKSTSMNRFSDFHFQLVNYYDYYFFFLPNRWIVRQNTTKFRFRCMTRKWTNSRCVCMIFSWLSCLRVHHSGTQRKRFGRKWARSDKCWWTKKALSPEKAPTHSPCKYTCSSGSFAIRCVCKGCRATMFLRLIETV